MDDHKPLVICFDENFKNCNNKLMRTTDTGTTIKLQISLQKPPKSHSESISADGLKFELSPLPLSKTTPLALHIRRQDITCKMLTVKFKCNYSNGKYCIEVVSCNNKTGRSIQMYAVNIMTSAKKSLCSFGNLFLNSQEHLKVQSKIRCPNVVLQSNREVRISPEANFETSFLDITGSTVYIDSHVYSIESGCPTQNVTVNGNLHVGRDATIGGNGNANHIAKSLQLIINGTLCNHGQIKAKNNIMLKCTNIKSCRLCHNDTSQHYLKAINEMRGINQRKVNREFQVETAVSNGDADLILSLLNLGIDPNAPLFCRGRSLTEEVTTNWTLLNKHGKHENNKKSAYFVDQRNGADSVVSLINAWNKRSGSIVSLSIVCRTNGNIDDLGQVSCLELNLDVTGNVTVEEKSICTLGEVSGKVHGTFDLKGITKIKAFNKLQVDTFVISQHVPLFVGCGGEVSVLNILNHKGYICHLQNKLTITTEKLETEIDSQIKSFSSIDITIKKESKYVYGTIEAMDIFLNFYSKCVNRCTLLVEDFCRLSFFDTKTTCGQLVNKGCIDVKNGAIEMESQRNKPFIDEVINCRRISARGILADSISVNLLSNSRLDIHPTKLNSPNTPNNSEKIKLRTKNLKIGKLAEVNVMTTNKSSAYVEIKCQETFFHRGSMILNDSFKVDSTLSVDVRKLFYYGSFPYVQCLNLKIKQCAKFYNDLKANKEIKIDGEGSVFNLRSSSLFSQNGCFTIAGSKSIMNEKGASIKGKCVVVKTKACNCATRIPNSNDFINNGLIESTDGITIFAGNIKNRGRMQSFHPDGDIRLYWYTKQSSVKITGEILAEGMLSFVVPESNFHCACYGGKSEKPDLEHSDDSDPCINIPTKKLFIECSKGHVFLESDIRCKDMESELEIICDKTCTIMSKVNVKKMKLNMNNLSEEICDTVADSSIVEDNTQMNILRLNGGKLILFTLEANVYKNKAPLQIDAAQNDRCFRCDNTLTTNGSLILQGYIELSATCKVRAFHIHIATSSHCLINQRHQRDVEICTCSFAANTNIVVNGLIKTKDESQIVELRCEKGNVYLNGTIDVATLAIPSALLVSVGSKSSVSVLNFHLYEDIKQEHISKSLRFQCTSNTHKVPVDLRLLGSLVIHCSFIAHMNSFIIRQEGSMTINGNFIACMKTFMAEKDAKLTVETKGNMLIQCDNEINLAGTFHCATASEISVECFNEIKFKSSFYAEFAANKCSFVSTNLIEIERGCSIRVNDGSLMLTNAKEDDIEIRGDIRIFGSIFGNRNTPKKNNIASLTRLEIEGMNVTLEDCNIDCFDVMKIEASTDCIVGSSCTTRKTGRIDIRALNVDLKGKIISFNKLRLNADEWIKMGEESKLHNGAIVTMQTSTVEIFGHITSCRILKINVSNALMCAKIRGCQQARINIGYAFINSGEIQAIKVFIKSPVFVSCPRDEIDGSENRSLALVIGGHDTRKVQITGLLLVTIGCCVRGKSNRFGSIMSFDFSSKISTIPTRAELDTWKSVSESSLSKLKNVNCLDDVQKLVKNAMTLQHVICKLNVSSRLCKDIVEMTTNIHNGGVKSFDVNQVVSTFERAHNLYSSIDSLRVKCKPYIRQKFKAIEKRTEQFMKVANEYLNRIKDLLKNKSSEADGIQVQSFIHQSEESLFETNAEVQISSRLDGLVGIYEMDSRIVAGDNICISAGNVIAKGRGMKAIRGIISLQGQNVQANQMEAMSVKVNSDGTANLSNVKVSEDVQLKATKAKLSKVEAGEKVSLECTEHIDIEQMKAKEGSFKAPNIGLVDKEGKAKHSFKNLSLVTQQIKDIDRLLDQSGAYKDLRLADELNLIVEDQDVIIANKVNCEFNVHIKCAMLSIDNNVSAKGIIAKTTKKGITVNKTGRINTIDRVYLKAKTGISLHESSKLQAGIGGISLMAADDIKSGADITSLGKNTFDAGRDISLQSSVHKKRSEIVEKSFLGICAKSTITEETTVDKSKVSGLSNFFKAGRNFKSVAAEIKSKIDTQITAEGKVLFENVVAETKTLTTKRLLGISCYKETESFEASHGSRVEDVSTNAKTLIESKNSDILWKGSTLKSAGNATERAEVGNIYHTKQVLTHKKSSKGFAFSTSENGKADISYANSSSKMQSTSNNSVDTSGSYRVIANQYETSDDVHVGNDMVVQADDFTMKGKILDHEAYNFNLAIGLDKTIASFGVKYDKELKQTHQKAHLDVGRSLQVNRCNSMNFEDASVDVGKIEGKVNKMTAVSNADTESRFGLNANIGCELVSKAPNVDLHIRYSDSKKIQQPTEVRIRHGSENFRTNTLDLTASSVRFEGKVDNFAKNVLSRNVHESQASYSLGLCLCTAKLPNKTQIGLSVKGSAEAGTYSSCITSSTGDVDSSISNVINTDTNKRRNVKSTFKVGVNLKFEGKLSPKLFKQIGKKLVQHLGKECLPVLRENIENELGIPKNISMDLVDVVEKGVTKESVNTFIKKQFDVLLSPRLKDAVLSLVDGNPRGVIQRICVIIDVDYKVVVLLADFLSSNKTIEDQDILKQLLQELLKVYQKYIQVPGDVSCLITKCIELSTGSRYTMQSFIKCPAGQQVIKDLLKLLRFPDEFANTLFYCIQKCDNSEKAASLIKLIGSHIGVPCPGELAEGLKLVYKNSNPISIISWLLKITNLKQYVSKDLIKNLGSETNEQTNFFKILIRNICKHIGLPKCLVEDLEHLFGGKIAKQDPTVFILKVIFFVTTKGETCSKILQQNTKIENLISTFNTRDIQMTISKTVSFACICLNVDDVVIKALEDLILEGDITYFIKKVSKSTGISDAILCDLLESMETGWVEKDGITLLTKLITTYMQVPPAIATDIIALANGEHPTGTLKVYAEQLASTANNQETRTTIRKKIRSLGLSAEISELTFIFLSKDIKDKSAIDKCKHILESELFLPKICIDALVDFLFTKNVSALTKFISDKTGLWQELVQIALQLICNRDVEDDELVNAIANLAKRLELKEIDTITVKCILGGNLSGIKSSQIVLKILVQCLLKLPVFADGFKYLPETLQERLLKGRITEWNEIIDDFLLLITREANILPDLLFGLKAYFCDKEPRILSAWLTKQWNVDLGLATSILQTVQNKECLISGLKEIPLQIANHFNFSEKTLAHLQCLLKGSLPACKGSEFAWDIVKDFPKLLLTSDMITKSLLSFLNQMGLPEDLNSSIIEMVAFQNPMKLLSWMTRKVGFKSDLTVVLLKTISNLPDSDFYNLFMSLLEGVSDFYGFSTGFKENVNNLFNSIEGSFSSEAFGSVLIALLTEILKPCENSERIIDILSECLDGNYVIAIALLFFEVAGIDIKLIHTVKTWLQRRDIGILLNWCSSELEINEILVNALFKYAQGTVSFMSTAKILLLDLAKRYELKVETTTTMMSVLDGEDKTIAGTSGINTGLQDAALSDYIKRMLGNYDIPELATDVIVEFLCIHKDQDKTIIEYKFARVMMELCGLKNDLVDAFIILITSKNHTHLSRWLSNKSGVCQSVFDCLFQIIKSPDQTTDALVSFFEHVCISNGLENIDKENIHALFRGKMTSESNWKSILKLLCQILTKCPQFSKIIEKLPRSFGEFLKSGNPTDTMAVRSCITGMFAQLTGVSHMFYDSFVSFVLNKKIEPFAEWIENQFEIDKGLAVCVIKSMREADTVTDGLKVVPLALARHYNVSEKTIGHLKDFLNGQRPKCDPMEFLSDTLKDICKIVFDKNMFDTIIKITESTDWLKRTISVLELCASRIEVPAVWIEALKDIITLKDPAQLISIVTEYVDVDKDLLLVIAKAVLQKEQPRQIIRNIAKVSGIPDSAILLLEELIRQKSAKGVKGPMSCLSGQINWSKALQALKP